MTGWEGNGGSGPVSDLKVRQEEPFVPVGSQAAEVVKGPVPVGVGHCKPRRCRDPRKFVETGMSLTRRAMTLTLFMIVGAVLNLGRVDGPCHWDLGTGCGQTSSWATADLVMAGTGTAAAGLADQQGHRATDLGIRNLQLLPLGVLLLLPVDDLAVQRAPGAAGILWSVYPAGSCVHLVFHQGHNKYQQHLLTCKLTKFSPIF